MFFTSCLYPCFLLYESYALFIHVCYCAFVDAEHALDPALAEAIAVNTQILLLSQPDCGEQALSVVDTLIRSGSLDIVVVDSVDALVPKGELEGEMVDAHMAMQARLMSHALQKLSHSFSQSKCILLFLNQVLFWPILFLNHSFFLFHSSIWSNIKPAQTSARGLLRGCCSARGAFLCAELCSWLLLVVARGSPDFCSWCAAWLLFCSWLLLCSWCCSARGAFLCAELCSWFVQGGVVSVKGDEFWHLTKVLRLKVKDRPSCCCHLLPGQKHGGGGLARVVVVGRWLLSWVHVEANDDGEEAKNDDVDELT